MIRISRVKEFIVLWDLPRVSANVAIARVSGCDRPVNISSYCQILCKLTFLGNSRITPTLEIVFPTFPLWRDRTVGP